MENMSVDAWLLDFLKTIILAALGYWFGRRQYLIQRDHEQITKRYLEEGIDIIIEGVEHGLGIFRENFAHSLRILKIFREKQAADIKMTAEDISSFRFLRCKQESFYTAPFYKLFLLIGDDGKIFYDQAQYLFSFVEEATNFFEYDLCTSLKEYIEGNRIKVSAITLFDEYLKKVEDYIKKSEKYYALIGELQKIAYILETNFIGYSRLVKFRERKDIRQSIERMRYFFNENTSTLDAKKPL